MNNAVHTLLQLANYFPLNGPFFFVHVVFFFSFPSSHIMLGFHGLMSKTRPVFDSVLLIDRSVHNAMPIDSRSAHNVSSDDVWHITSS